MYEHTNFCFRTWTWSEGSPGGSPTCGIMFPTGAGLVSHRRVGRCPDGRDVRSFVVYNTNAQAEEERKQQRRRVLEGLEENMEHFYNIRGMFVWTRCGGRISLFKKEEDGKLVQIQKDSEEVVIFKELADNSARERYQNRGADN